MILGRLEFQFYSCAHASKLSSVGRPNSTTRKGHDNHRGEEAMFDILPKKEEAFHHANQKLPVINMRRKTIFSMSDIK